MRVHVCVRHLPTGRERIASEFSEDLYDSIDAFLFNWNIKLFLWQFNSSLGFFD